MEYTTKFCTTGAIAALTAFWGWCGWLWMLWLLCLVADHITGTVAACKAGEWSSTAARAGIWGKLASMIVVLVIAALDFVLGQIINDMQWLPFHYTVLLFPMVLAWYILTEVGSILENASKLGAKVPKFLVRWIAGMQKQVGQAGEAAVARKTGGNEDL